MFSTRAATADDLDAIAALTALHRERLAGWAPLWWAVADGADALHPLWLGHLIATDGPDVRVVLDGGAVVGCAVVLAQAGQWFVDDVALAPDASWSGAGAALVDSVDVRPALTCVAAADVERRDGLAALGLQRVSSYWMRAAVASESADDARPLVDDVVLPDPPRHTFGGPFDPMAEGALAITVDGGLVVGSPSVAAPPVYDPGGTVAVVDRVVGDDPSTLLGAAHAVAATRGDVVLAVVAGVDDGALIAALDAGGFARTVDVLAWPDEG